MVGFWVQDVAASVSRRGRILAVEVGKEPLPATLQVPKAVGKGVNKTAVGSKTVASQPAAVAAQLSQNQDATCFAASLTAQHFAAGMPSSQGSLDSDFVGKLGL